jgi:hypothetical protein
MWSKKVKLAHRLGLIIASQILRDMLLGYGPHVIIEELEHDYQFLSTKKNT